MSWVPRAFVLCLLLAVAGVATGLAAGRPDRSEPRSPPRPLPSQPTLIGVGHPESPDALSWAPDSGRLFAVAGVGGSEAGLFRIRAGRRPRRIGGFGRAATATVSPDARRVAAYVEGEFGARIEFRSLGGRLVSRSAAFARNFYEYPRLIWSPDSRRLVVPTADRTRDLRVLDAATGRLVGSFDGPAGYLDRQLWSPDGRRLALPTRRGARLVDVATRRVQVVRAASDNASYAWSPDGTWLATSDEDNAVVVVEIATGRRCRVTTGPAFGASWSPDGRLAFFPAQDEGATTIVIGIARPCIGARPSAVAFGKVADDDGVGDILTWSPDGRRLALSLDAQV